MTGAGRILAHALAIAEADLHKLRRDPTEPFTHAVQPLLWLLASNAIQPIAMMPSWLRAIAHGNPLTYLVDALRASMVAGAGSSLGLARAFAVMGVVIVALVGAAARLDRRLAR